MLEKKETPTRRRVRIPKSGWPNGRWWRCGFQVAYPRHTSEFRNGEQHHYNRKREEREHPFPATAEDSDLKKDFFLARYWIRQTLF